jgi:hypothetical protein
MIVALGVTVSATGSETAGQTEREIVEQWRQPAVKTEQPASMTCKKLLATVEARTKKVKDFQVTFETVAVKPRARMVTRSRTTVVLKGPRTYIDNYYSKDPNATVHQFRRVVAFNGKRSTTYEASRGVASVESKLSREADTQGHRFFDLNLLNAPREARRGDTKRSLVKRLGDLVGKRGNGRNDQSLLSLLRNSKSKVRPLLEKIGGRNCHVVDCGALTVWLDAKRGCVPLRQIFYDERNPKQIVMVFLVRRVTEVAPSFWVATRGRKFNSPTPGVAKLTGSNEKIILVTGWESNKPTIRINADVPDKFFDLWQNLPPGTRLWDKDKDETRIVFVGTDPVTK